MKNSLYAWLTGLVRLYLQNSPKILPVMVIIYLATAGLS